MGPPTTKKASIGDFEVVVITSARSVSHEKTDDKMEMATDEMQSAKGPRKRSDDEAEAEEEEVNEDRSSDLDYDPNWDKKTKRPRKPRSPAEVQAKKQKARLKKRHPYYESYPQHLKDIVDEYEEELQVMQGQMQLMQEKMKKRIKGATNSRDHKSRSAAWQKKMREGTVTKLDKLGTNLDSQTRKNEDLRQDLEKTAEERNHHRQALDGVCAERLELLKRSDVPAQDDGEVKRQLGPLLQSCREWTKAWGFTSWADADSSTAAQIKASLLGGDIESFGTERAGQAITQGRIPPRVLLLALLNRELSQKTFIEPLTILKPGEGDQTGNKCCWETLELLMKRLRPAAERMRAMMLLAHTVQPSAQLDDPSGYDLFPMETRIQKHVRYLMHRTSLVCTPLLRNLPPAEVEVRSAQLQSIVRNFIEAGIRTNAQNPRTSTFFRDKLLGCKFAQEDHQFEPHRALKLQEDEDDDFPNAREAGLEGRGIDLVDEPAIVRIGDKDGLIYDKPNVLIKAVVWMVRDEDLRNSVFAQPNRATESHTTGNPKVSSGSSKPTLNTKQPQPTPTAATAYPVDNVNGQSPVTPKCVTDDTAGMRTKKKKRLVQASESPHKKQRNFASLSGIAEAASRSQEQGASDILEVERSSRSQIDLPGQQNEVGKQGQTVKVDCNIATTSADSPPASTGVRTCPAGHLYCVSPCR